MNHYQFGRLPGLMELTMMERRGEITPVQFMEFAAKRRKATSGAKDSEPSKSQTCRIGGKVYKIAKTRNGKALQCGGKKRVQLKDAAKVQALRDAGGEFDGAIAGKPYKVNAEMLLAANKMGVSSRQLAAGRVPADLQTKLRRKFNEMTIGDSVTKPEVVKPVKPVKTETPPIETQATAETKPDPTPQRRVAKQAFQDFDTGIEETLGINTISPKSIWSTKGVRDRTPSMLRENLEGLDAVLENKSLSPKRRKDLMDQREEVVTELRSRAAKFRLNVDALLKSAQSVDGASPGFEDLSKTEERVSRLQSIRDRLDSEAKSPELTGVTKEDGDRIEIVDKILGQEQARAKAKADASAEAEALLNQTVKQTPLTPEQRAKFEADAARYETSPESKLARAQREKEEAIAKQQRAQARQEEKEYRQSQLGLFDPTPPTPNEIKRANAESFPPRDETWNAAARQVAAEKPNAKGFTPTQRAYAIDQVRKQLSDLTGGAIPAIPTSTTALQGLARMMGFAGFNTSITNSMETALKKAGVLAPSGNGELTEYGTQLGDFYARLIPDSTQSEGRVFLDIPNPVGSTRYDMPPLSALQFLADIGADGKEKTPIEFADYEYELPPAFQQLLSDPNFQQLYEIIAEIAPELVAIREYPDPETEG